MKNRLKDKRLELNLTQEELSKISNVSRPIICGLENNTLNSVGSKIMSKLAVALKCKESDIFFVECVKNTKQKEDG